MIWLVILIVVFWFGVPAFLRGGFGVRAENAKNWRDRVALRYQNLYRWQDLIGGPRAIFVWVFARVKMRLDPMFAELPEFIRDRPEIGDALDIGCGFGVAGCALLEWRSTLKIYGVDPDSGRVPVARQVFGERGNAFVAGAPDFVRPEIPQRVDLVLVLDVIHFIPDAGFSLTLQRIRAMLGDGGLVILRAIVPPKGGGTIWWKIARLRRQITGGKAYHRSVDEIRAAMEAAGFEIRDCKISGGNAEMWWFIATGRDEGTGT